jgi:glycosyltransferase involved in cell wall biosynthesis
MGAITFSLDQRLVKALKSVLPLSVLVETGTFKGDTVEEFKASFDKIWTVELSENLWSAAVKRFKKELHIQVLHGQSDQKLLEIVPNIENQSVLYWLDAHWCAATDTAGELSQCPLLKELKAIGQLNSDSVLLIDDARFFLSPPLAPHEISQWPNFHQIITSLIALSKEHSIMVINDVIAFYPNKIKSEMDAFAQTHGVDWPELRHCLVDNQDIRQQLEEKEVVIRELARALTSYRLTLGKSSVLVVPVQYLMRLNKRIKSIFAPRLGNLNQYPPRPMQLKPLTAKPQWPKDCPKVTIVTPSFQQGDFIERTILSVLNQQYPNLEYLVQDGGSKDSTVDVLKKYQSQLTGWVSEKDNGQSQAINLGLAKSTGDIMAWLNSDDLLLPGALEIVIAYFKKHPEVDVVYGNRLMIDENDMEIGRWIVPGHNSKVLSWADYIPQETLFWRRSIWDKAGGEIDETFRFAMDWDLLVRFRQAGAKFAHIPEFLGAFRIHEQQKTSAVINEIGFQEMNRIRARINGANISRKEIRKNIALFMLKHIMFDLIFRVKSRLRKA